MEDYIQQLHMLWLKKTQENIGQNGFMDWNHDNALNQ